MTLRREEQQSLKNTHSFLRDLLWQKIPPKKELTNYLRTRNKMIDWISVKDRLPEKDGWVIWHRASDSISPCLCLFWDKQYNDTPTYKRVLGLEGWTDWAYINLPETK